MTLMDAFRSFLGLDERKWNTNDIRDKFEIEFKQNSATFEEEFERQMRLAEEMFRELFSSQFSFHNHKPFDIDSDHPESFILHGEFDGDKQQPNQGNLRDHVLKPESETNLPNAMESPSQQIPSFFDRKGMIPKLFPFSQEKQDIDYDESVQGNQQLLDGLIKDENSNPTDLNQQPKSWFSSNSISVSTITKPDGSTETKRIERNSNGDEEITVTQSFGDQSYSYKKRIKSDGSAEINENFVNMDQDRIDEIKSKLLGNHSDQRKLKDSVIKDTVTDDNFKSILFPKLTGDLFDE